MSQAFKLLRLQQIDSRLDQIRTRLGEIERLLADNSEVQRAASLQEKAQGTCREADKILRRAEELVQAQRIKIEQTEAALYGGKVRNPKELQDLQNESAALKRYLATLEDRQLDAMLAQEEAEAELNRASQQLEAAELKSRQKNDSLHQEQVVLQKDLARDEQERPAAASGIAPADLQIYEQLRAQRRGVAVSPVVDRTCSACGSTLSASQLSAAHSPNQLTRCETCGRILYIS